MKSRYGKRRDTTRNVEGLKHSSSFKFTQHFQTFHGKCTQHFQILHGRNAITSTYRSFLFRRRRFLFLNFLNISHCIKVFCALRNPRPCRVHVASRVSPVHSDIRGMGILCNVLGFHCGFSHSFASRPDTGQTHRPTNEKQTYILIDFTWTRDITNLIGCQSRDLSV